MDPTSAKICILFTLILCVNGQLGIFLMGQDQLSSYPLLTQKLLEKIIGTNDHAENRVYGNDLAYHTADIYPDDSKNIKWNQPAVNDNLDFPKYVAANAESAGTILTRHFIDAPRHCRRGFLLDKLGKCRKII